MLQAMELVAEKVRPTVIFVINHDHNVAISRSDTVVVALPQWHIFRQVQIDDVVYSMVMSQAPPVRICRAESTGENHQLDLDILLPRYGLVNMLQASGSGCRNQY
ncbi:hypothetical protein GCM10027402_25380 [Arthrobacter monumenti]